MDKVKHFLTQGGIKIGQFALTWFVLILPFSVLAESVCLPQQTEPEQLEQLWIQSGTYFTGAAGYASVDWLNFSSSPFVTYNKNQQGGVAYGFTVGYRWGIYPFALEGGFYKLPSVAGTGVTTAQASLPIRNMGIVSWFAYLLGKFRIHIVDHLFVIVGAGAAYREFAQNPNNQFTNPQPYYYAATVMAGLEWYIVQDWFLFSKYMYVPAYRKELPPQPIKQINAPEVNMVVFGVGYKFSI